MLRSAAAAFRTAGPSANFSGAQLQQARHFSQTKPKLWDHRDVRRRWDSQCESRFRLVGPSWSQVLIHKLNGMAQRNRGTDYAWRARGRWRRLSRNFQFQYKRTVLQGGVGGVKWRSTQARYNNQEGLC